MPLILRGLRTMKEPRTLVGGPRGGALQGEALSVTTVTEVGEPETPDVAVRLLWLSAARPNLRTSSLNFHPKILPEFWQSLRSDRALIQARICVFTLSPPIRGHDEPLHLLTSWFPSTVACEILPLFRVKVLHVFCSMCSFAKHIKSVLMLLQMILFS